MNSPVQVRILRGWFAETPATRQALITVADLRDLFRFNSWIYTLSRAGAEMHQIGFVLVPVKLRNGTVGCWVRGGRGNDATPRYRMSYDDNSEIKITIDNPPPPVGSDAMLADLESWFGSEAPGYVTIADLRVASIGRQWCGSRDLDGAMRSLNFRQEKPYFDGKQVRCWVRGRAMLPRHICKLHRYVPVPPCPVPMPSE